MSTSPLWKLNGYLFFWYTLIIFTIYIWKDRHKYQVRIENNLKFLYPRSTGGGYTVLPLSVRPSVRPSQYIFRRIFLSNYWWQKSDIWSQALYRYAILWEAFLDTSNSYFLFADLVGFYTHWTFMRVYHKWALAHSSSCFIRFYTKTRHGTAITVWYFTFVKKTDPYARWTHEMF